MLTMNVYYRCKPGMRGDFMKALEEIGAGAKSRAEVGNSKYDYFLSADDEDLVLLVEKWDNEEVLKAHTQTAHFQLLAGLKDRFVETIEIEKF